MLETGVALDTEVESRPTFTWYLFVQHVVVDEGVGLFEWSFFLSNSHKKTLKLSMEPNSCAMMSLFVRVKHP